MQQNEDPWGDVPSYSSQRSNEFASSFDDYSSGSVGGGLSNQSNNW